MATDYSPVEITYFKAVVSCAYRHFGVIAYPISQQVEQIMLAPREAYSVSSLVALREVNSLKTNMTKAQAEIVLGSFVAKGWLSKSRQGYPSL